MSDEEYEDQDLDDFLKKASNILTSEDDEIKATIIQTINNHLLTIIDNKEQCENFFSTINSIIFPSISNGESSNNINNNKNFNKQSFLLYPIVYFFNPKLTINYIDYFLSSLKQSISEENKLDFSFLSSVFSDIINIFYNNNNIDNERNKLLDKEQKENLFLKFFDFISNFLKINKKIEQSFGFLLLNELIEKCPLIKEDKYLKTVFRQMSDFLDDRWFESKLDLLNCTINLIFKVEQRFKPYANVCLFRILDYLTDNEWMKRKLAINILYTLVFYCKEEILAVKKDIIEFLNILREDNVADVREVCLQTLKFIEESDPKITNHNKNRKEKNNNNNLHNKNITNISNNINNNSKTHKDNSPLLDSKIKNIIKRINNNYPQKVKEEKKYDIYEDIPNNIENNKNNSNNNIENNKNNNSIENNKNNNNNINNNSINNNNKFNSDINKIFDNNINNDYNLKNSYFDKGFYLYNLIRGNSKSKSKSKSKKKINNNINNSSNFNRNININNEALKKESLSKRSLQPSTKYNNYSKEGKNNNNINKRNNYKVVPNKLVKNDTYTQSKKKIIKDKLFFQDIETQINDKKLNQTQFYNYTNPNIKKKTLKFYDSQKNYKKNIYENNIKKENSKEEPNITNNDEKQLELNEKNKINHHQETILIGNDDNSKNNNLNQKYLSPNIVIKEENKDNNDNNENSKMDKILEHLNKIQDSQNDLLKMMSNLKNTVDVNYYKLDKRIAKLENIHNINTIEDNDFNKNEQQNQIIDDEMKIEIIKNKYISGKYNEAIIDAKQKDKYLFRLLPLIVSESIPKIDLSIIEDLITELSEKLPKMCVGDGKSNINIILSFFNQVIRSRINLKLIIQMNLKDILQLMKNEYLLKMSQNDITIIDIILKSLKV